MTHQVSIIEKVAKDAGVSKKKLSVMIAKYDSFDKLFSTLYTWAAAKHFSRVERRREV